MLFSSLLWLVCVRQVDLLLQIMEEIKNHNNNDIYDLCKSCRKLSVSETDSGNSSYEKCSKWLRTASFSDGESVCSSEISDRSDLTKLSEDSECYSEDYTSGNQEIKLYGDIDADHQEVLFRSSVNSYKNVTITKSKNVHLGNITYINGPVYINQTANIVNSQTIINQYINDDGVKPPRIISRMGWLAQPPLQEYEERKKPAKLVIIIHSATDEAKTEADNILHVRLIQQFHVESRKWDDIGYNFLVGADGNVYEGRGWKAVGAHTYFYNQASIGIAFIGYYVNKLPPQVALNNAKQLIEYGVKIGAIDEDYQLLGHCQCSTTESPGRTLFEEIKTWKHWNSDVSVENPSPEISDNQ